MEIKWLQHIYSSKGSLIKEANDDVTYLYLAKKNSVGPATNQTGVDVPDGD